MSSIKIVKIKNKKKQRIIFIRVNKLFDNSFKFKESIY